MRFLLASILVASASLVGCGGKTILVGEPGGPDDGRDAGDDGAPTEDVVIVDVIIPPPSYDAPPPIYDAEPGDAIIIETDGGCLVDLEPCIYPDQCCSGICEYGNCGGNPPPPPPPCLPDGEQCTGSPPCCSGACLDGYCGGEETDSGPVSCSAPTGNACLDCLAGPCCPQLGACETDFTCSQTLACFEGCYAPGQGDACFEKCNQMYPSPLATNLASCGAGQCPSCD